MRIHRIDLLRSIGLFMIIAAHLSPPDILHQLRNFDVPLMVLVSGVSFQYTYRADGKYSAYVWKRFKRLVAPVWIFLTLRFLAFLLFSPGHPYLNPDNVVASYLLSDSVDYLWIIRVFLMVALAAPFLYRLNAAIRLDRAFFGMLLLGIAGYQLLQYTGVEYRLPPPLTAFTQSAVYYLLPYGLVFLLGMRLVHLRPEVQWRLFYCFLGSFVFLAVILGVAAGGWVPTQNYKYPVAYYYLAYALTVSLALWVKGGSLWRLLGAKTRRYVLFVSQHSIWMYLWHIPLVRISRHLDFPFVLEYPAVVVGATLITWLQLRLLESLILPALSSHAGKQNVRLILMG